MQATTQAMTMAGDVLVWCVDNNEIMRVSPNKVLSKLVFSNMRRLYVFNY